MRYKGCIDTLFSHVGRSLAAAVLGAALVASACGGGSDAPSASATEATPSEATPSEATGGPGLPSLVGNTVAGGQIDTNDLAGQDVAIWFWAPW